MRCCSRHAVTSVILFICAIKNPSVAVKETQIYIPTKDAPIPVSPCPEIFEYERSNGGELMGYVSVTSPGNQPIKLSVTMALEFYISGLHGSMAGQQQRATETPSVTRYMIRFPPHAPPPELVSVELNGRRICRGTEKKDWQSMLNYHCQQQANQKRDRSVCFTRLSRRTVWPAVPGSETTPRNPPTLSWHVRTKWTDQPGTKPTPIQTTTSGINWQIRTKWPKPEFEVVTPENTTPKWSGYPEQPPPETWTEIPTPIKCPHPSPLAPNPCKQNGYQTLMTATLPPSTVQVNVSGLVKLEHKHYHFHGEGDWSKQPASTECNCSDVVVITADSQAYCSPPLLPPGVYINSTDFRVGSSIEFVCRSDISGIPSVVSTCTVDRIWNRRAPSCGFVVTERPEIPDVSTPPPPVPGSTTPEAVVSEVECGTSHTWQDLSSHVARPGEWPWLAAIFAAMDSHLHPSNGNTPFSFLCSGTLVSLNHILTSAGCLRDIISGAPLDPSNLEVYLGKQSVRSAAEKAVQSRTVSQVTYHDRSDLALLQLSQPAGYSAFVRPVCLQQSDQQTNNAWAVGWRSTDTEVSSSDPDAPLLLQLDLSMAQSCGYSSDVSASSTFDSYNDNQASHEYHESHFNSDVTTARPIRDKEGESHEYGSSDVTTAKPIRDKEQENHEYFTSGSDVTTAGPIRDKTDEEDYNVGEDEQTAGNDKKEEEGGEEEGEEEEEEEYSESRKARAAQQEIITKIEHHTYNTESSMLCINQESQQRCSPQIGSGIFTRIASVNGRTSRWSMLGLVIGSRQDDVTCRHIITVLRDVMPWISENI